MLSDEDVILAIMETSRHWARNDFLALSNSIPHGSAIPTHVGDIGTPQILRWTGDARSYFPGKKASPDEIERYRLNSGNVYGALGHNATNSLLAGYYAVTEDERLLYTGQDAKIPLCSYTRRQRTFGDAVMNATSTGLASATVAQFTSADIGGVVLVYGVGFGNGLLAARLDTVVSPTAAKTDTPALASGTSLKAILATLQSPNVYAPAIVCGALGRLMKEGDDTSLAESYFKQQQAMLAMIRRNEEAVPEVERPALRAA